MIDKSVEAAAKILNNCVRRELRDHAFNDREISWFLYDEEVGGGYFGGGTKEVSVQFSDGEHVIYVGDAAKHLATCGRLSTINRNDETGPDYYAGP